MFRYTILKACYPLKFKAKSINVQSVSDTDDSIEVYVCVLLESLEEMLRIPKKKISSIILSM